MEIIITTGIYNCSDYKVVRTFKYKKPALNFIKSLNYPFDELYNTKWNFYGKQFKTNII